MADVIAAVVARLEATAGVTALVGSGAAARINVDQLQQAITLPAITVRESDREPEETLAGIGGFCFSAVTVDCLASTAIGAEALREQVRLSLAGYRGTSASVVVRSVQHTGGGGDVDPSQTGADQHRYLRSCDFRIGHTEATS